MCEGLRLAVSAARRAPEPADSERLRAPMQGLILNESSYALNLIPKGDWVCMRGCTAPGRRVSGATARPANKEPKKCARSVQMSEKVRIQFT